MSALTYRKTSGRSAAQRIHIWYASLVIIFAIFIIRLFYVQIIQHEHYSQAAISSQLKEYQIPAERGVIAAHDGDNIVPIVLNEKLYTLFADPQYVKDTKTASTLIAGVIGGDASKYSDSMKANSRYVVLAKKLTTDQKKKITDLNLKGIGTREEEYRTYPQGSLAAQLLGFVNDDGEGKYGVEQALNAKLQGSPGQLKAITDAQGVPLVANKDNVVTQPTTGKEAVLTIDVSMQRQLEDILKAGLDTASSKSGGAVILDANTGAVKAMANYPTYNPAEFYKVEDASVFNNAAVSDPLEIGSIMKPFTTAAALDQGVVNKDTTYYDPNKFVVDGTTITNVEEDGGAGKRSLGDILQLSLNTGATWLLMQMGGGQINEKARLAWHDYMANHYQFGKLTGIEQGYEAPGTVPDPENGFGLNIQYANTAFGQGMTATPLQIAAALAGLVNGGTYYKPYLIDGYSDGTGKLQDATQPKAVKQGIIKPETSQEIRDLMQYVVSKNYQLYKVSKPQPGFMIGGKTGTAQISKPEGGYFTDKFNGTFEGFVGGANPKYVIAIRVNDPHVSYYAGAGAAAPIFGNIVNMLLNNFGITPGQ